MPTQAAQSRPRRKAAPLPIAATVAVENQRAEAGDLAQTPAKCVLFADAFDLVRDRLDVDLHLLPLLPQALQQPAQARAQVLFGIFHHSGKAFA